MDFIRRRRVRCLEASLYTDGVLCVLSAPMANQVGAVDPVDELSLSLEPLHWSCKPAAQESYELDPPVFIMDQHATISALSFAICLYAFTAIICSVLFSTFEYVPWLIGVIDGLWDLEVRANVDICYFDRVF